MRRPHDEVLFESHDAAWRHFLSRTAPLASLRDRLSDDPSATLAVWLVPLADELRGRLGAVQDALGHLPFLRRVPGHFLHVTVAGSRHARADGGVALAGLAAFPVRVARVGCFPEAVIAEVEGDGLHEAARRLGTPLPTYLPHVSIAYTWEPGPAGPVRAALEPWRDHVAGEQLVDEIQLCEVPASRSTLLRPWRVVDRVRLG